MLVARHHLEAADKLEPILCAPQVSVPVWSLLRDVSPEWILPGVGDLPRNSVSLLATNQKFIEAFMIGLNHEMNRELLWNGYPTDQRGTYFQQFWDFRGWVKGNGSGRRPDRGQVRRHQPDRRWDRTTDLGTHIGRAYRPRRLVLLVRGDVIKRYPNVVVYAVQAKETALGSGVFTLDNDTQSHPVFQSVLTGDVAYYGFDLTRAAVRGSGTGADPGWYFVLQEHPSEPKFNQFAPDGQNNAVPANYVGAVAAQVAESAYDTPLRVAIHGQDLIPA